MEEGSRHVQYLAVITANLNTMICGITLGWLSPTLTHIMKDNPISLDNPLHRPITTEEASWIGSLLPLGVMCGCLTSSYIVDWSGPKHALLINTVPLLFGWILLGTTNNIIQMCLGRFVLGTSFAIPYSTVPLYAGEISDVPIRGTLGSLFQIFLNSGIVIGYSIGAYVSYTIFSLICAILLVIAFVCLLFIPESPYYLISKGRAAEASEALAKFRGKNLIGVQKEIDTMKVEIEEAYRLKESWSDMLRVKLNRKAMFISCSLMFFIEFTGIDVVNFYVEPIFRDAGTENTAISAIIFGAIQVIASSLSPLFIDRFGRRTLLIISSIGNSICLAVLGLYFFIKKVYNPDNITWIPLPALIAYIIAFNIGWGPATWPMFGEIFPPGIKFKAAASCTFIIWLLSFILTKLFVNIGAIYGIFVGFWIFSIGSAFSIIFVSVWLPETKGKTLHEIQQKLSGNVTDTHNLKYIVNSVTDENRNKMNHENYRVFDKETTEPMRF